MILLESNQKNNEWQKKGFYAFQILHPISEYHGKKMITISPTVREKKTKPKLMRTSMNEQQWNSNEIPVS